MIGMMIRGRKMNAVMIQTWEWSALCYCTLAKNLLPHKIAKNSTFLFALVCIAQLLIPSVCLGHCTTSLTATQNSTHHPPPSDEEEEEKRNTSPANNAILFFALFRNSRSECLSCLCLVCINFWVVKVCL